MSSGQIAFAVWSAVLAPLALLMAIARTNPEEFTSNLSKWAAWVGVKEVPNWLKIKKADELTFKWARIAFISMLFFGAVVISAIYNLQRLKPPTFTQFNPSPKGLMAAKVFLMNIDFPDKGALGLDSNVRLIFTFQNKTEDEISIRRLFLIQAIKRDIAYNGDSKRFGEYCFDPAFEPPDEVPQPFRGKPMYHPDHEYISFTTLPNTITVDGEKKGNTSISVGSKRNVSVDLNFDAQKIDLDKNLTVYCPVLQFYDGEGKPKTARCKGSSAGYTLLPDGRSDGLMFGGYFQTASIMPIPDLHNQCVIFDR